MYLERFNDPAQSFSQNNENLRFSPQNPYDYLLYYYPNFFALELKTTEGTGFTYWKEEYEDKIKHQSFMIKKHQINSLTDASKHRGIIAGFIINFRKTNHTYFLSINKFNEMVIKLDKKSFNEADVIEMSAYLIGQTLKKINYKYDIESFVNDMIDVIV